eukprot:TRINITY_DN310_c0_g1_i4.p5 TRINITY_DN310_c0_g1~~TRINITY_DN310_c0_g1_i4.p5  ORF type:complete len:106 (-),score=24.58 TRINITY_DN310_c0_g1_i4:302-619(-)
MSLPKLSTGNGLGLPQSVSWKEEVQRSDFCGKTRRRELHEAENEINFRHTRQILQRRVFMMQMLSFPCFFVACASAVNEKAALVQRERERGREEGVKHEKERRFV